MKKITNLSKLSIAKARTEVKKQDDIEASVRKSKEAYIEIMKGVKDPEYRSERKAIAPKDQPQEKKKPFLSIPRNYWIEELKDLNLEERGIYSIIIAHAIRKPNCWPSILQIAKIGNCDYNTAKKYYNSLIKKGIVKVIGKKGRVKELEIGL